MSDNLTPNEGAALCHWSLFGQKSIPPTHRVQASDCRAKPFLKPIISPWNQTVPRTDVTKLLNGFMAQQMEDKWIVYAEGPDTNGRATVYMCRSWTGHTIVELKLQMPSEGEDGDARFVEIVWESSEERYRGQTEEGAKGLAKEVCRWCLDVTLP